MSTPAFAPGQRWVSNTESELGLGIVIEIANRRVEMSFPAAGERRTYAVDNAPVSRVRYAVGEIVSTEDDLHFTIDEVLENNGCLIYSGTDQQGNHCAVAELDLNSFVQFSKPQDRLFAGQIDKNRDFDLRCETISHLRQLQLSPVRGLLGARVQLLPHQLYIAAETAARYAPRVLLADEVGLGKTIEAGLVIHQQLMTGMARRVLIVVPDSLLHQWLVEMLRRFNLMFTILDEERCQALAERGDEDEPAVEDYNPFESAQLVLCTLSFIKQPQRLQQAQAAGWDLLAVDEAHHLQWSENNPSNEYLAIDTLSRQTRGLLLLTATPEQLGVASHFARLRLLDPDRYYDLQRFIDEEQQHQPVNALVQSLLDESSLAQPEQWADTLTQVADYLGEEQRSHLADAMTAGDQQALAAAVATCVAQLLDRHGTGRVLFRNTRASVQGFPDRKLHTYPLQPAPEYSRDTDLDHQLYPELQFPQTWITIDPRVEWLAGWLRQHRGDKVLLICSRAQTALELEEYLRLRCGVQSAVFHEGLSLVARDRAAAYFADDEDGAQLLVCSEIGSEGRNFQFSHHLVLFDLPLNPDLLEQRIGRLDRIGQRFQVEIHVPFYRDSAQQCLMRWYHEGINAFEHTCAAGLSLFEQFADQLRDCLRSGDQAAIQPLLDETRAATARTLQALQEGRDRLLELNSCNQQRADTIVEQMLAAERRQELSSYMERLFDQFGVEQEHHSAASVVVRPGDHMLTHHFPALPEDGLTATFSRDIALSREDMHFFTWEHPMVTGAMDMVLNGEFGNTAFCVLKLPPLKPGTVIVESIFTLLASGPGELQLHRYLPLTTLRVVLDSAGNDLSKVLSADHFHKLGQKVPKRSAQDLVRHARAEITGMVERARQLADKQLSPLLDAALAALRDQHNSELSRLEALARVNPNIRAEEIQFVRQSAAVAGEYIQKAQLKLDAIRVAVVTE